MSLITSGGCALKHYSSAFLELSTLKKLYHFENNFDAEWLNGISFVLQVSLYNGGLYNPYGSRTVSPSRGRWWGGRGVGGHSLLRKKKPFNLTCNNSPSCETHQLVNCDSPPSCEKVPAANRGLSVKAVRAEKPLAHQFLRERMRIALLGAPPSSLLGLAVGCWVMRVGVQ